MDGPQNDKGMYAIVPVAPQMSIRNEDVITWNSFPGKPAGHRTIGFMSQVSPDGQYCRDHVNEARCYVANFKDYRFLQVFYPTRGILAWYSRATGGMQALPGADDPRYVQTNAVWSPDGKYLVFARAEAKDPYPEGRKLAEYANDPNETQIQYDLYRIPFNAGQGRPAGTDRRRLAERHEQHLPQGLARWPLDRLRAVPQRPVDASRQPALHRAGRRRPGAADAVQHAADELLAQLFAEWPLAGLFLEEPLALHADVPDAPGRRGQRQPGDPDRERHGGQPRGEHSRVREHPAGRLVEDRRAGRRVLPAVRPRAGAGGERPVRGGHRRVEEGPGTQSRRRQGPQQPRSVPWPSKESSTKRSHISRRPWRSSPSYAEAHNNLGVALAGRKARRSDRAVPEGPGDQRRVRRGPQQPRARPGREGKAATKRSQHWQKAARELKPNYAEAHNNLGTGLFQKGRLDEAIAHWQKAVEVNPTSLRPTTTSGVLWPRREGWTRRSHIGRGPWRSIPEFAQAHFSLGDTFYLRGKVPEALAHWREGAPGEPNHLAVLKQTAWVLATCPEASVRNGTEAVGLAERAAPAIRRTRTGHPRHAGRRLRRGGPVSGSR